MFGPDPKKIAARYVESDNEHAPGAPSADLFLDLATFLLGWEAMHKIAGGEQPLPGTSMEAVDHYAAAIPLLRRFQPTLAVQIEGVLGPLMDRPEIKRLQPFYRRGIRPTPGIDQALTQAELIREVFSFLRSRAPILRETFQGRAVRTAMALGSAAEQEDPRAVLNLVSVLAPLAGMQLLRKWNMKAADLLGAAPSATEALLADATSAKMLGEQLRDLETRIANMDPNSQEAADLQIERQDILGKIDSLAEGSSDPTVVKTTAVAEATTPPTPLRTETGRQNHLSPKQEDAMMVKGKSIIAAGAGSGKTRVLSAKVVYTIRELGVAPNQIIATSFSRKSAHELIERIKKLGGDNILDDKAAMDGFGTTHSVAGRLMGKYRPRQGFAKVIDGSAQSSLIKMAMEQVKMNPASSRLQGPEPGADQSFFPAVGSDNTPIDQDIGEGSKETGRSVFVRALGAAMDMYRWMEGKYGSKPWLRSTMSLIESMKGRNPDDLTPKEKEAVNKALGHPVGGSDGRPAIQKKLQREGLGSYKVGSQLRRGAPQPSKGAYWNEPANQWFNLGATLTDEQGRPMGSRRFGTAISKWKGNLVTPGKAWADEQSPTAAVYGAYEWLKQNDPKYTGRRDHDDTLIDASAMLVANPAILKAVQQRFKYIMVDEAQDLNRAQHLLFGLISGYYDPATQKPRADGKMTADTYTFIGDDKQAIYEFRGAEPGVFIGMSDLIPEGQGFETKMLETNYRSGKAIVDAAQRLIDHNKHQIPMRCDANVDRKGLGSIQSVTVESHEAGAILAANQIEDLISGDDAQFNPGDFGVAVRTNAEALAYGVELLKRGIPFRSRMNFFNDATTKSIVNWLNLVNAAPGDRDTINEVVLNAYNAPRFWLDKVFDETLQKKARGQNYLEWLEAGGWMEVYDQEWRNRRNVKPYMDTLVEVRGWGEQGLSANDILTKVLHLSGSEFKGETSSLMESLVDNLVRDAEAMDILAEESPTGEISDEAIQEAALAPIRPLMSILEGYGDLGPAMDYVKKLQKANEKKGKKDSPDAEDYDEPAVVIDTVHGWKGLECKRLYVNMPAGVFPHARAESEEELASERRLGYVALTRGEDSVTVIAPKFNHLGKAAGPSLFISQACIPDATQEAEEGDEQAQEEQPDDVRGKTARWTESELDAFLADWGGADAPIGQSLQAAWWGKE